MTLDQGRSPYYLVTRMEILLAQLETVKEDELNLKSIISGVNTKIRKISEKIDELERQGDNYITIEDIKRNRCSSNEIILLLKKEKQELYLQRNFLDEDLDATSWRLQDIEENYSKLVNREKELYSMSDHVDEVCN